MSFKQLLTQNIAKRILLSFFLFSFLITAISIAAILYSQYTNEKTEVFNSSQSLINSRIGFISEVLWNIDKPLAELSIEPLADNPNITYIAIYDENNKIFTNAGNENTLFSKSIEIPLERQHQDDITKFKNIGTVIAHVSNASAVQHVKDNFINILLVQTFKSIITSFVFLFLIYHIMIKHLNKITSAIVTNSNKAINTDDLIRLDRNHRNDELQLLAETLNKNKLERNKHLRTLDEDNNKLTLEIASRTEAERKATNAHEELQYVLNSLTTAVYFCNSDGKVMFMNHKALKLLSQRDSLLATKKQQQYLNNIVRFNEGDNINSEPLDLAVLASSSKFISRLNAFYMPNDGQAVLTPVDLTIIPTKQNSSFKEPNFIVVVKDKSVEAKLEVMNHMVSHDYLTQVHNRMYLNEQLEIRLAEASGDYSLAIIDLDKFKMVNDTGGHCAGDQLLKLVAETIPKSLGHNDILARIGGDEFAVLFKLNQEDSVQKSFKIIADIEDLNFTYNGKLLPISCSIGITDLRIDDIKTQAVMTRADKACYQVKRNGKGSVLTYRKEFTDIRLTSDTSDQDTSNLLESSF